MPHANKHRQRSAFSVFQRYRRLTMSLQSAAPSRIAAYLGGSETRPLSSWSTGRPTLRVWRPCLPKDCRVLGSPSNRPATSRFRKNRGSRRLAVRILRLFMYLRRGLQKATRSQSHSHRAVVKGDDRHRLEISKRSERSERETVEVIRKLAHCTRLCIFGFSYPFSVP